MVTGKIRQKLTSATVFKPLSRFRFWFIPLIVLLLLATGWWMRSALAQSVKARTAEELRAILGANVTALELWMKDQRAYASVLAGSEQVRGPVRVLEDLWRRSPDQEDGLIASPEGDALNDYLLPLTERQDFDGFAVVVPDGTIIASGQDNWIGARISPERVAILARTLAGEALVSHPFRVDPDEDDEAEDQPPGAPIMVVAAPVRGAGDRVIAMLALLVDPDLDFTRVLQSAQIEQSGETYAFDSRGLLISHSRFDDQLREIGLIPADPQVSSLLSLEVRDPGGDLLTGYRPADARDAQPLTLMAASAVAGQDGVDVDGYRDYRGVMVVGAWTWLPEYGAGIATEIDLDEALAMPAQLRRIFWIVVGGFVLVGGLVLAGTIFVSRAGRRMNDALLKAQQLGQYTLEDKLGEGGMGQVFRARHAMLRRPTAIKLMHPDRAGQQAIARFEREVQLTSQLTHPNTIAIFDYGRTPDGVFYYAMEYLPGIDLAKLVETDGPQPQGRVIGILRQVCGSLGEAHASGLIHRDIKPENVILCERGGRHDVAKVLDFGIVKDSAGDEATRLTAVDTFTGTPLYVPPEAWRTPDKIDPRADIYALGAVAYFLLTGQPVFEGGTVVEIYNHHLKTRPVPPSRRTSNPVADDLERVVLQCLEKDRGERPASTYDLADALAACQAAGEWGEKQARDWWSAHAPAEARKPSREPAARRVDVTATVVAQTGDLAE